MEHPRFEMISKPSYRSIRWQAAFHDGLGHLVKDSGKFKNLFQGTKSDFLSFIALEKFLAAKQITEYYQNARIVQLSFVAAFATVGRYIRILNCSFWTYFKGYAESSGRSSWNDGEIRKLLKAGAL